MIAFVTSVFIASLVGSLHCAGMCGGVVALCVSGKPARGARVWTPHLLYNTGRLATYASLGAVSGAVGAAIDFGGSAAGLGRAAIYVAGAIMIGFGLVALLRASGARLGCVKPPRALARVFERGARAARLAPAPLRPLILGALTGFLPCGWLYAFVAGAAGTGSPLLGAVTMAAFWLGTLPVMLGVGLGLDAIATPLRRHVPTISAAALVVVGIVAVSGRLSVPAYADTAAIEPTSLDAATEHIESIDATALPCCHDDP